MDLLFIKRFKKKTSGFQTVLKLCLLVFIFQGLLFPQFVSAHGGHNYNERDIEEALRLFEKAYQLSPDLLPVEASSFNKRPLNPYYLFRGEKIPLNQSFIVLMREWIHILSNEVERHCEDCRMDRELILEKAIERELLAETAEDYSPENRLAQAISKKVKHGAEDLSYLTAHYTAKYGKVIAGLIGIVEAFETAASFMMGLKGVHLICTPLQILIIPAGRKIQRYGRTLFYYGFDLSHSSLLLTSKMAWTTRILHKKARNTFFYIDRAFQFNEEKLKKRNNEGPRSLYYQKGHRLLWLEKLKNKTDPLFSKLMALQESLDLDDLTEKQENKKKRQVQNIQNKIERLTKINRKEFFGDRFKRYLFLKSRKGRQTYMDGADLKPFDFIHKTLGSRSLAWPLAPQFMIEGALGAGFEYMFLSEEAFENRELEKARLRKNSDNVISGLAEEFLSRINLKTNSQIDSQTNPENLSEQRRAVVEFFISDFHNIFDTSQKSSSRVMSASAVEILLTQFFAHYLKLAESRIPKINSMSYREKMRIYSKFGQIQNRAMEFTDFLTAVSFATDPKKINFYKYESIEKFFAFLDYFNQIGRLLKQELTPREILSQIDKAQKKIDSFSLIRAKNSRINFMPFVKMKGKCYEITRKYK